MSYHVQGDILKLDILIPRTRIGEALEIMAEYDPFSVSATILTLNVDEQTGGTDVIANDKGDFHITEQAVSCLGGNKSIADEFFKELALKFNGTFEARFTGEDGDTWAVKVIKGQEKKVKVVVVEED